MAALAVLYYTGNYGHYSVYNALVVNVDGKVYIPVIKLALGRSGFGSAYACIVDKDMDFAEGSLGLIGGPYIAFPVGYVQLNAYGGPAVSLNMGSTWSIADFLKSAITMFMPSLAQAFAIPRPSPLAPPVIKAVFPFKFSTNSVPPDVKFLSDVYNYNRNNCAVKLK